MSVHALKFAFRFAFIVNMQEIAFGGSTAVAPQDTDDMIIYVT